MSFIEWSAIERSFYLMASLARIKVQKARSPNIRALAWQNDQQPYYS